MSFLFPCLPQAVARSVQLPKIAASLPKNGVTKIKDKSGSGKIS
jgi:hypothetical protein